MAVETIKYDDSKNTPTNVEDRFFNMTTENIREELEIGRSKIVNVCMNLTSDYNKSSIIRANNAFLGKEVWLIGKRRFDRRGAVGSQHYETIKHVQTLEECIEVLKSEGYFVWAVDNTPSINPQVIYDADIPEKSAFVYGEEQAGLSAESVALCDGAIYQPQWGSVRSINVAQMAAVVMSEYSRRWRR
jgi:tRNA G18 (ribose-2'-O)-methylase SpoU